MGVRLHQIWAVVSGLFLAHWPIKPFFVSVSQLQRFVKGYLHDGDRRNGFRQADGQIICFSGISQATGGVFVL